MIKGRKIITLCGSTRFKDDYVRVMRELALQGNVVLTVAFFEHADNIPLTTGQKQLVDEIHLRKIDLADMIYVINKGGYVGESTRREIEYARANGKEVTYMEPPRGYQRNNLTSVPR